jgi:hypothetical protein
MADTLEIAVDYYINDSINKISDNKKKLVREKLLASKWISFEEQKPRCGHRILEKTQGEKFYVAWYYGSCLQGPLKMTHWKPLIKR